MEVVQLDSSGRLINESISLNSVLLQESHQSWETTGRTLQIEDYTRSFYYQEGKLKQIITGFLTKIIAPSNLQEHK